MTTETSRGHEAAYAPTRPSARREHLARVFASKWIISPGYDFFFFIGSCVLTLAFVAIYHLARSYGYLIKGDSILVTYFIFTALLDHPPGRGLQADEGTIEVGVQGPHPGIEVQVQELLAILIDLFDGERGDDQSHLAEDDVARLRSDLVIGQSQQTLGSVLHDLRVRRDANGERGRNVDANVFLG